MLFKLTKVEPIFELFNTFRKEKKFTDVSLVVMSKNGVERALNAHRLILSATIPFFHRMFATNMRESKEESVYIKGIDADVMELILDLIYGCEIDVDVSNFAELLEAADYFGANEKEDLLLQPIVAFLSSTPIRDASVALSIRALAQKHSHIECLAEFVPAANSFIRRNLGTVIATDTFCKCSAAEVASIFDISRFKLNLDEEINDAASRWLQYDETGRRHHASRILDVVRNYLAKPTAPELYAFDWDNCMEMAQFDCEMNEWQKIDIGGTSPKKGNFALANIGRNVFITGGFENGVPRKDCQIVNLTSDEGVTVKSSSDMKAVRAGHCALSVEDDKIIVFGGASDENYGPYSSSIECFDGHIWSKKGNMRQRRYGATGSVVNGAAFVLGRSFGKTLNTVERFDHREGNNSVLVKAMKEGRCRASAACHNGLIYVTGGNALGRGLDSVEIYDARADQWRDGPRMKTGRWRHALISDGARLLAIGGNWSDTMEEFSPEDDEKWRTIDAVKSPFTFNSVHAIAF